MAPVIRITPSVPSNLAVWRWVRRISKGLAALEKRIALAPRRITPRSKTATSPPVKTTPARDALRRDPATNPPVIHRRTVGQTAPGITNRIPRANTCNPRAQYRAQTVSTKASTANGKSAVSHTANCHHIWWRTVCTTRRAAITITTLPPITGLAAMMIEMTPAPRAEIIRGRSQPTIRSERRFKTSSTNLNIFHLLQGTNLNYTTKSQSFQSFFYFIFLLNFYDII